MKEIQDRFDKGYTMSLYGTRELLYEQMLEDISSLLNLFSAKEKQIEDRIKWLGFAIDSSYKEDLKITREIYKGRKHELELLLGLWKH